LKNRADFVKAVGALAEDAKEQIYFGERRKSERIFGHLF
jgi:hypothetical protein